MPNPLTIQSMRKLADALREGRLPIYTTTTYDSVATRLRIAAFIVPTIVSMLDKSRVYPVHRIVPRGGRIEWFREKRHLAALEEEGHALVELPNGEHQLEWFEDHWANGLPPAVGAKSNAPGR